MKHPVTNEGTTNLHCGETVIRPGETRMIDEHLVPPDRLRPEVPVAPKPAEKPLVEHNATDIIAALLDLPAADLDALEAAEQAKGAKARKGVLEAIATERLRRAAANEGGDKGDGKDEDAE